MALRISYSMDLRNAQRQMLAVTLLNDRTKIKRTEK